jgi:hypothetical protein
MNDGTPVGVRVEEVFMAAVLIGPHHQNNNNNN